MRQLAILLLAIVSLSANAQMTKQPPPSEIDFRLDRADIEQNSAFALKVIGVGLLSWSLILSQAEYDSNLTLGQLQEAIDDRRMAVQGFALTGGVLFTIGLSLDLSARKKTFKLLRY